MLRAGIAGSRSQNKNHIGSYQMWSQMWSQAAKKSESSWCGLLAFRLWLWSTKTQWIDKWSPVWAYNYITKVLAAWGRYLLKFIPNKNLITRICAALNNTGQLLSWYTTLKCQICLVPPSHHSRLVWAGNSHQLPNYWRSPIRPQAANSTKTRWTRSLQNHHLMSMLFRCDTIS